MSDGVAAAGAQNTLDSEFDGYVGIDWSGAAQAGYAGVAVARCGPGRHAPQLIRAPGKTWTRSAVLDWLLAELARPQRLLIGFDFAFALPGDGRPAPQLWAEVETRCAADGDLLGRAYAENDRRFWTAGPRPAGWNETPRAAEAACRAADLGNPQTPFQLIGAKQVGKGALAGMRLLHRLDRDARDRVAIWPFDGAAGHDRRSVVSEIYPRLFIRQGGLGNAKLRDLDDLNAVLNRLNSIGITRGGFDDHEADALVTAAGLRATAGDAALWAAGTGEPEGWIFGVPKPA
ncbi:hypothetical protein [Nevskia sp.]|uniref:hypothetical protein n=1 Tax=Nevskia sp. TaxID=1929292 RepID=UPI00260016C0|nr:hypothetical protein [Nevskia sp.]